MNDGASVRGEAMRENVKSLTLRLSAEEYARLCRLAELSGLKLEPTVRSLIMGAQLRPRPPETWTAVLRQLSGIGTNINQIAKVANCFLSGNVRPGKLPAQ